MTAETSKSGKLLQFPVRKGNAEIHVEAEFKYANDPQALMANIRMKRIMDSLNRINELMRELKGRKYED